MRQYPAVSTRVFLGNLKDEWGRRMMLAIKQSEVPEQSPMKGLGEVRSRKHEPGRRLSSELQLVRRTRALAVTFRETPSHNQINRQSQKHDTTEQCSKDKPTHLKVGPAGVDCIDPADDGGAENAEKDDRGCGSRESW